MGLSFARTTRAIGDGRMLKQIQAPIQGRPYVGASRALLSGSVTLNIRERRLLGRPGHVLPATNVRHAKRGGCGVASGCPVIGSAPARRARSRVAA